MSDDKGRGLRGKIGDIAESLQDGPVGKIAKGISFPFRHPIRAAKEIGWRLAHPFKAAGKTLKSVGSELAKHPYLGIVPRWISRKINGIKAFPIKDMFDTMMTELKTKILQLIKSMIDALNKETKMHGKEAAKEAEKAQKANPGKGKDRQEKPEPGDKGRPVERPVHAMEKGNPEKALSKAAEKAKGVPKVDIGKSLDGATKTAGAVAGPGMEAGAKALTGIKGR